MVSKRITAEQVAEACRDLGRQLAAWRRAAGLTQAEFGPQIGYSRSAVANVETGRERAPLGFWQSADRALSTRGALQAAYRQLADLENRYRTQVAYERDQARVAKIATLRQPEVPGTDAWMGASIRVEDPQLGQAQPIVAIQEACEFVGIAGCSEGRPPVEEPQLRLVPEAQTSAEGCRDRHDAVTLTIMSGGQTQSFRMRRRVLLELAASVAAAPMVSAMGTLAPSNIDPALVDHFATLRALLVQADNRLGGLSVLPTVKHQVELISQIRREARGSLRDSLLSTEARWSEFASWLSDDLGDSDAAARWLDRAASMAQEAQDHELYAFILGRAAQRAVGTGDEDRVVGLARTAARIPGAPVLVQAFAAVQEAQGSAADGDTVTFQTAMHRARTLISEATDTDAGDTLGAFCTSPYLNAHEGEGWLRLNKPSKAVSCFTTAVNEWPESYRRERGMYLSRTAHAYLAASEPDQAAHAAGEALALAAATGSARIRRNALALGPKLAPFRGRSSVKSLLEQMAGAW
ncbi:hypothetical protein GCM10027290_65800 [Micromonospora sonneratiae]